MDAIFNNPVAWAHYQIRGGWKNHVWSTAGYTLLIAAVIGVTHRLSTGGGGVLLGWTTGLLGLQAAILGIYGSSVVGNAIRRDISAGLLESYRMMPIGAATGVVGYLTGPSFQAICLAVATVLIGTVTGSIAGVPLEHWYVSNVVVVTFIVFMWVCFAFASFVAKNAFTALFGLMFGGFGSGGALVALLPALAVLLTPLSGRTVFSFVFKGTALTPAFGLGLAAQIAFGSIFFRGAMRRFRRDDVPALGAVLGLLLLATWVGTSAVGIRNWDIVNPVIARNASSEFSVKAIGSLLSSMLIGLVPVAGSARLMTEWTRTTRSAGRTAEGRPASPVLVTLLATLMIPALLMLAQPTRDWDVSTLVRVGVIGGAFFVTASYLLRYFHLLGKRAGVMLALWMILTWLIPLGADAVRHNMSTEDTGPLFSLISPVGSLIDMWDSKASESIMGLVVQVMLAATAAGLFYSADRAARQRGTVAASAPGGPV